MQVQFDLTPDDYYAFLRFQVPRDPQMRALHRRLPLLVLQIGAVGAIALGVISYLKAGPRYSPLVRGVTGALSGLSFVLVIGILYLFLFLRVKARGGFAEMHVAAQRRAIERGQFQMAFGHHLIEIGPEGYMESNADGQALQVWDRVVNVFETPAHIFLFKSVNVAYIVPKRAFPDPAAIAQFLAEVAGHRAAAGAPQ
jgi:hypothetical protein